MVDHAVEYVRGEVHTKGLENFWSLLKRGIKGTYVSVEPYHLFRYLDGQAFRYNNRKGFEDKDRFDLAVVLMVGKRLTFDQFDRQGGSDGIPIPSLMRSGATEGDAESGQTSVAF